MGSHYYGKDDVFIKVTDTAPWMVILMQTGMFGYVLYVAANMIGDGADLLLLIPSYAPFVGTLVIPILGAVPDGMLVLFSGLGQNPQEEVRTGVGALAGSTIMLLTMPWLIAVFSGRVSIVDDKLTYKRVQQDHHYGWEDWKKLTPGQQGFFNSGVAITQPVRDSAMMMLLTATSYLWIQVPACFYDQSSARKKEDVEGMVTFGWIGLLSCVLWFLFYIFRTLFGPSQGSNLGDKIVHKQVDGIKRGEITIQGVMANLNTELWSGVINDGAVELSDILVGGQMQQEVAQMCELLSYFFTRYDVSRDGLIGLDEFRFLLKELQLGLECEAEKNLYDRINTDNTKGLDFNNFVAFIICFSLQPEKFGGGADAKAKTRTIMMAPSLLNKKDDDTEGDEDSMPSDLASLSPEQQQKKLTQRAFVKLCVGTFLVVFFSDPMVHNLTIMGNRLHSNPFYISFLLAPIASNMSELVAAQRLASKKTISSIVNSLCSLEGAAIMNNTFCLAIFLFLVVYQKLTWTFSSEVVSIIAVEVVVAIIVFTKQQHRLFDAFMVLLCYPCSLALAKCLHVAFDHDFHINEH